VHAGLQVFVCSGYDLCSVTLVNIQTHRQLICPAVLAISSASLAEKDKLVSKSPFKN